MLKNIGWLQHGRAYISNGRIDLTEKIHLK